MTRREEAISMLEQWRGAVTTAEFYEAAAARHLSNPVTAETARREADDLREEILMLMGIDETPAAKLEVEDGGT